MGGEPRREVARAAGVAQILPSLILRDSQELKALSQHLCSKDSS